MARAVMLEVAWAEAQAVRTLIVGAGCSKMPKTMALEIGLPVVGVIRLQ